MVPTARTHDMEEEHRCGYRAVKHTANIQELRTLKRL